MCLQTIQALFETTALALDSAHASLTPQLFWQFTRAVRTRSWIQTRGRSLKPDPKPKPLFRNGPYYLIVTYGQGLGVIYRNGWDGFIEVFRRLRWLHIVTHVTPSTIFILCNDSARWGGGIIEKVEVVWVEGWLWDFFFNQVCPEQGLKPLVVRGYKKKTTFNVIKRKMGDNISILYSC